MADDPQTPPQNAATDPNQKSPLDILEEILSEKGASAGDPGGMQAEASVAPVVPEPPQPTAEELAQLEAARLAQDQAELQQKQAELQTITQTPQYQARVEQEEAAKQQHDQQETAQEGFEIKQIEHTKIADQPA